MATISAVFLISFICATECEDIRLIRDTNTLQTSADRSIRKHPTILETLNSTFQYAQLLESAPETANSLSQLVLITQLRNLSTEGDILLQTAANSHFSSPYFHPCVIQLVTESRETLAHVNNNVAQTYPLMDEIQEKIKFGSRTSSDVQMAIIEASSALKRMERQNRAFYTLQEQLAATSDSLQTRLSTVSAAQRYEFNDIFRILTEAKQVVGQIISHWDELMQFYRSLSNVLEAWVQQKSVEFYLLVSKTASYQYRVPTIVIRELGKEAEDLATGSEFVKNMAGTYLKVTNDYLLPQLDGINELLNVKKADISSKRFAVAQQSALDVLAVQKYCKDEAKKWNETSAVDIVQIREYFMDQILNRRMLARNNTQNPQ